VEGWGDYAVIVGGASAAMVGGVVNAWLFLVRLGD
jgi:hypothetical protein